MAAESEIEKICCLLFRLYEIAASLNVIGIHKTRPGVKLRWLARSERSTMLPPATKQRFDGTLASPFLLLSTHLLPSSLDYFRLRVFRSAI